MIYIKMDLALNNLQRLICHKTQQTKLNHIFLVRENFKPALLYLKNGPFGTRGSRKARNLWGMMRGVGGVRKSIHQIWLAKGLGLGLLCWGFKGVQEEIPRKEASTHQIGSVAFPPGQYTSPQLHPCTYIYIYISLSSLTGKFKCSFLNGFLVLMELFPTPV